MQSGRAVRVISMLGLAVLAIALTMCGRKPTSGRYCSIAEDGECVWVDLDHDLVTFYEKGRPNDVKATYADGAIDARPENGKYAGKSVRLSFNEANPAELELVVSGPTAADTLKARYLRKY